MSNVLHPNEKELDILIQNNEIVFIDFYASWCGPCKMLSPEIEKLADAYEGKVKVVKIDVDQEPLLAQRFHVQSIPNLFVIKHGNIIRHEQGYLPYPKLVSMLGG